jgi:hypothetical protein
MSEMLKKIIEDAEKWRILEECLKEKTLQLIPVEQDDKHLKGYIYDSLVFRYMKARDAEAELERLTQKVSYETSVKRANRDKMRFMDILNEAIGEHD